MATGSAATTTWLGWLLRMPSLGLRDLGACERNLWTAAALAAGLILGFEVVGWGERFFGGGAGGRLVGNAAEASTRYFTIPHVVIGFLFMVTSTRNRTATKRIWLLGLLAAGVGLCFCYEQILGAGGKLLATASLYLYFLLHELRDELHFYQLLGDAPPRQDKSALRQFGRVHIALLLMGTIGILWVSGTMRTPPFLAPPGVTATGMIWVGVLLGVCWTAMLVGSYWQLARRTGRTIPQAIWDNRRLIRLFGAVFAITIVGAVLTGRLYPIVLLHVAVWYVFTCRALKKRPPVAATPGTWSWMRGTLTGFRTLHIGLAVVLIAVGALAIYGRGPADGVWWLIAPEALPYWTIMHISVSFVPR